MSEWMDLVKKCAKENPGKPLKEVLKIAKKEYRKSKPSSGTKKKAPTKKRKQSKKRSSKTAKKKRSKKGSKK